MNEEDQLTTNIEPGLESKRPVKKKKTAAKKAAPGKPVGASGKSSTKPSAVGTKATKKAPSASKKPGKSGQKKAPRTTGKTGGAKKPGKSPKAGAKTPSGKKPSKPAGSGKTSPKPSRATKTSKATKPGKSKAAASTKKVEAVNSGVPSKRTYQKHLPEGVDITTLRPTKDYGITRIAQDNKKNFGYYVRVGPPKSRTSVFFSDKKHGGTAKALKAATEKRNELFNALPDWYKVRASRKRKVA